MAISLGEIGKQGGGVANNSLAKPRGGLRVAAIPAYNYQSAGHVFDRN